MYLKSDADELLDAVTRAGGCIESRRLSPEMLEAVALVPSLKRLACDSCRVELIAHHRTRFCASCAKSRSRFEPARRGRPGRRPR